jgi:hypothetical protein
MTDDRRICVIACLGAVLRIRSSALRNGIGAAPTEPMSEGRTAPAESKTTGLSALRIMARERPAEFAKM